MQEPGDCMKITHDLVLDLKPELMEVSPSAGSAKMFNDLKMTEVNQYLKDMNKAGLEAMEAKIEMKVTLIFQKQ